MSADTLWGRHWESVGKILIPLVTGSASRKSSTPHGTQVPFSPVFTQVTGRRAHAVNVNIRQNSTRMLPRGVSPTPTGGGTLSGAKGLPGRCPFGSNELSRSPPAPQEPLLYWTGGRKVYSTSLGIMVELKRERQ